MKAFSFFILIGSIFMNNVLAKNIQSEAQITEQFYKYMSKTQNENDKIEFKEMIEVFSFPQYVYRNSFDTFVAPRQDLICVVCRSTMTTVQKLQNEGSTESELVDVVSDLCTLLEIETADVCRGVILLNLPIMLYIMRNQPTYKAETFCGVTFQTDDINGCPFEDKEFEWSIDLPVKNVTNPPPAPTNETFKIVQVSDLHYDPVYEAYGLADCNEPTCCRVGQVERASNNWDLQYNDASAAKRISRTDNGSYLIDLEYANEVRGMKLKAEFERKRKNTNKDIPIDKQAGYWGDYRHCDTPFWAVEDCLDKIAENHQDFDYIYYTGDTTDHGVWETTNELITESQRVTVEKFVSTFPGIPVFPILGNHESQPVNQYAPTFVTDSFSSNWMYNMLAEKWSVWLPESAAETIKLGGYYTVLLRPGFRIVAINSNMHQTSNWWLHMQPKDINGQLQWLTNTLHEAELNNERVHILSHIPARGSLYVYTREYKRIVERFADTIAAEFNGHTHTDELKVFYSRDDINRPLFVAWNGGSVTANAHINPNYKVYEINSNSYEVADFETWIFNLTEANLTPQQRPRWFKEYSFKEQYGMTSLSLEDMDNLVTRMVTTDKNLIQDFNRLKSKTYNNDGCDSGCIQNVLRILTKSEMYDVRKSEALWEIYNTPQN